MKNINPGDEMTPISGGRNSNLFATYFNRYYATLVLFAKRLVGDLKDAEDITADVFANAIIQFENRDISQLNPKAYLFIAVRNGCFEYLRKNKVKAEFTLFYSRQSGVEEYTGDNEKLLSEVIVRVHNAIAKLPPQSKRVLIESSIGGKSRQEIADLLSISPLTVKKLRESAMKRLREELGNSDPDLHILYLLLFFDNQFIEAFFS